MTSVPGFSTSNRIRVVGMSAILMGAFAVDLATPRGFSDWVLYLLALIAATRVVGNRSLKILAGVASGCTVLGLVFSPPGQLIWISVFSRSLALILVWAIVWTELNWRRRDERLRRLEKAVEGSSDIVLMTDPKGNISFINPAFTDAYGYRPDEVLGKTTPRILKGGHVDPEAYKVFWEMLLEKQAVRGEFINKTKDGRLLTVDVSASTILDASGNTTGFLGIQRDITERKQAEAALRESEEQFRSLFQNMLDGFAYCKMHFDQDRPQDFTYLKVNKAFETLTGLTNVVGKKVSEVIPGLRESSPDLFERYGRVALTGQPERFETYVNALRMWFSISVYSPEKEYFVVVFDVISMRKRAEEELYQSRQMLQNILDTIPQRVFWKDTNISYLGCNKAFAMDAGLKDPAEIKGKNDSELAWRESAESYRADDRLVMEGATPRLNFEETQSRPDGSLLWLRTSKLPMRDREGRVIGLIGIYEDITDHKRADAALKSSEIRYRRLFESAKDGILILDAATENIVDVNPFLTELLGYPREAVVGKKLWELGAFKDIFASKANFAELQSNTYVRYENLPLLSSGGRPIAVEFVSNVYHVDGMKVIQCNIRDNTERAEAVKELKKTQEQFLQAQKMEAVGRLAGGVAHDFNNLLTIINGYCELMLGSAPAGSPDRSQLEEIRHAGERAAALTRQLLAFSRKQVVAPTILDLNSVVEGAHKMLLRIIGEDVKLVTDLAKNLGPIKADPGQVEQVLMNLVVNARDAMPNGGSLTIETSNTELGDDYARSHAYVAPGEYVMLAMSDTGCGMDAETQSHIFEPFYTTKGLGKGTGLGLSTVYGIVKQSGGHVQVYSEEGKGTTFRVYFPRMAQPGEVDRGRTCESVPVSGTETILLVEDEPGVRNLAQRVLQSQGYTVLTAGAPDEALERAGQHPGKISLLITDVVMPGMNGKELADQLVLTRPELAVLFISGYTADAIGHHGILDKGIAFLPKPFTPRELLRNIRQALDGKEA